jgi:hypothetical protein
MSPLDPSQLQSTLKADPEAMAQFAAIMANQRDYLEVFADRDFKGVSQRFSVASYRVDYDLKDLTVPGGIGDNTISSLKMPNSGGQGYGFMVTLFVDPGCRGAGKVFRGDADYVGDDINDKTSSIRIESMLP